MSKIKIVGELGEQALLFPSLVNEALAANERAKYLMTLLQAARGHADRPDQAPIDLRAERLAADVPEPSLDTVVALSRRDGSGSYLIPEARRIHDLLVDDVRRMLAPLPAPEASGSLRDRFRALLARASPPVEDRIDAAEIDRITAARPGGTDSLHLLVMDLHRELNRIQERLATERIDGACVYEIRAEDRPLIAAFMAGVNRTRELKFDHPGLGTTATRSGPRLVIQNDIGLTEAHVLVVHVEGDRVALTYTDNHLDRLLFFQGLLDRFAVHWEDSVSRRAEGLGAGLFHLGLGTYPARDRADLEAFLTFLGSRLVFLIDWNRARKRLRKFAPRRVGLAVLRWAADHDLGHGGFLALGGDGLIFDALQAAGTLPLPPGGQLSDVLGPERVGEFLKFTLRAASEGLRAGRSEFLIRDEISAELRHYIDTAHQGFLGVAAEHAALIVELAMAARDTLLVTGPAGDRERLRRTVDRARTWEHRADGLVSRSRMAVRRGGDSGPIRDLLITADDGADALEDALFRLSLLFSGPASPGPPDPLRELAELLVQGAQEYLKAVEDARQVHRGSPREQIADFLEAVDRTITIEHQTDEAHRRAEAAILGFPGDFRQWLLFAAVADQLEGAADALMRSVLILRDDILGEVLRR